MSELTNFFPPWVVVHVSSRHQDFTLGPLQDELSDDQKIYLKRELNLSSEQIFYGRQVHGNRIIAVGAADVPQKFPIPQADGFITQYPGIALAIRTADCLPVFMYDPKKKVIGMVHAGWRGTAKRIAALALSAMQAQYGTRAQDVLIGFGPCIRPCCYEVGEEVRSVFPSEISEKGGKTFFDLALANRRQLLSAGVKEAHLGDEGLCTCCRHEFYSHRREGETAGRHLSLIMFCA